MAYAVINWYRSFQIRDGELRRPVHAGVVELVDTLDLGSSGESRGGSSPSTRTISQNEIG